MKVEILEQNSHKFLWINGDLWMWDLPFEVQIQRKMAEQVSGDVLVVGCGLGILQRMLRDNPEVDDETLLTIEKHREVYEACRKHNLEVPGGMFICDFFDAIPGNDTNDPRYDYVIGDIWPEIDPSALDLYFRFQEKAREFLKPNGTILAWGKDFYEYLLGMSYDYHISSDGTRWWRAEEVVL